MTGKPTPAMNQLWRHYKGNAYVVVCIALREQDRVPVVVYRGGEEETWTRPLGEFLQKFEFEAEGEPHNGALDRVKVLLDETQTLIRSIQQ